MATWRVVADIPANNAPNYENNAPNSPEQQGALETWINVASDLKTQDKTDDEVIAELAHKGCPAPDNILKMYYMRQQDDSSVQPAEENTDSAPNEQFPPSPTSTAPSDGSMYSRFVAFVSKTAAAADRYSADQLPSGVYRVQDRGSGQIGLYSQDTSGNFAYKSGDLRGMENTIGTLVNKQSSMPKGSPYPEHSYENAPNHSAPGHHLPEKVNAIYNAIMREHPEYGKEKAMKIAWERSGLKHEKSSGLTFRGQSGTIVERYSNVWGEEMVRFATEGGVIDVPAESLEEGEAQAPTSPVDAIQQFINTIPEAADRASTQDRVNLLSQAHTACRAAIANSKLPLTQQIELDRIALNAALEAGELTRKIAEGFSDGEQAYLDSRPEFSYGEGEASEVGPGGSDGWLDQTYRDLQTEAENRDYERDTDELAATTVAPLDGDTLADADATRSVAFASLRTSGLLSGLSNERREEVTNQYLGFVEWHRKCELADYKHAVSKVASKKNEADDLPDEAMWL